MTRKHVATLCGDHENCCPEIYLDVDAAQEKQVITTDDHGNTLYMSKHQFRILVQKAKEGAFDNL